VSDITIYAITNKVSENRYIGSTTDFDHRIKQHFAKLRYGVHCNPHLQAAFIKYGKEAFDATVVEECAEKVRINREQHHIDVQGSNGYNLAPAGTPPSRKGHKHSKETRAKISAANTGHKHSEKTKAKIALASGSRRHSEETKAKISLTSRNRRHSEEAKAKISAANKGQKRSEESKTRMSLAQKGRKTSDETKVKLSIAHKGKKYKKRRPKRLLSPQITGAH